MYNINIITNKVMKILIKDGIKMKFCKKCGAENVDEAVICPKCGVTAGDGVIPTGKKEKTKNPFYKKWWFWVIVGVVVISIIAANGKKDSVSVSTNSNAVNNITSSKKIDITVTAEVLAKAYVDNEIKANQDYKDKTAEITGNIKDIGEMLGQTYIILDSRVDFSITDIQCFFSDKAEISKIANLKKGDIIKIIGKIDGKSLNVSVNDCYIINN